MTREEIIRNLKYMMKKHKNDTVHTFDTNISVMCKDILDYLEQEPKTGLNDREKRIFLAAIDREKEVCEKVDKKFRGEQEDVETLVSVCNHIRYKVMHSDLWEDRDGYDQRTSDRPVR